MISKCKQVLLLSVMLLPASQLESGGVYKWTDENGQVHFGDAPPPSVSDKKKIQFPESDQPILHEPANSESPAVRSITPEPDYYSSQNQLIRMQEQRARERQERREKEADAAKRELYEYQQEKAGIDAQHRQKTNAASCNLYTARINEQEELINRSSKNDPNALKNNTKLAQLKRIQAHYCR